MTTLNHYTSQRIWYIFDNIEYYRKNNEKFGGVFRDDTVNSTKLVNHFQWQEDSNLSSQVSFPVHVNVFSFTSTLVTIFFKKLFKII